MAEKKIRRRFARPETFRIKAAQYFEKAREAGEEITLTGFCLHMKFRNRHEFARYAKEYPEFDDVVAEAKLRIEHEYEQRLYRARNPTGTIVGLKALFGWRDQPEKKPEEEGQKVILNFNLGATDQTITIDQAPKKEITDGRVENEIPNHGDEEEGQEEQET